VSDLAFFPGMRLDGAVKRRLIGEYLERLHERYEIVPMGRHVDLILTGDLPERRMPLT
jgi:hypothetical protein